MIIIFKKKKNERDEREGRWTAKKGEREPWMELQSVMKKMK